MADTSKVAPFPMEIIIAVIAPGVKGVSSLTPKVREPSLIATMQIGNIIVNGRHVESRSFPYGNHHCCYRTRREGGVLVNAQGKGALVDRDYADRKHNCEWPTRRKSLLSLWKSSLLLSHPA